MVRTILKLAILFLVATVLHWLCLALFGSWGISVNVMLVFMVAVCAYSRPAYGYPVAFICGLFLDFFGVKLFGHHACIFTLCAMMVYGLEKRIDFNAVLSQMVCVLLFSLFAMIGNSLLLKIFADLSSWNGWSAWLGGILLSTCISPAVFWLVRQLLIGKTKSYSCQ